MPTRVAILDDYQSVALSMADWSALGAGVSVQPLHERIGKEDEIAERLRNYDVIVAMRERTPFPATLIGRPGGETPRSTSRQPPRAAWSCAGRARSRRRRWSSRGD